LNVGGWVRFGGLVFKAYRLVYHSTLGLRVIKKKKGGSAFERNGNNLKRVKGFYLRAKARI